jgi:hypothetical protein
MDPNTLLYNIYVLVHRIYMVRTSRFAVIRLNSLAKAWNSRERCAFTQHGKLELHHGWGDAAHDVRARPFGPCITAAEELHMCSVV